MIKNYQRNKTDLKKDNTEPVEEVSPIQFRHKQEMHMALDPLSFYQPSTNENIQTNFDESQRSNQQADA